MPLVLEIAIVVAALVLVASTLRGAAAGPTLELRTVSWHDIPAVFAALTASGPGFAAFLFGPEGQPQGDRLAELAQEFLVAQFKVTPDQKMILIPGFDWPPGPRPGVTRTDPG